MAELPGNDWKLALKLSVRTGLDQAPNLRFDRAGGTLASHRDCDGRSTSGAHVVQTCDRKFLAFGEQIFVTRRESHHKSGQPVLVERRLDLVDKLPTASHQSSMPTGLTAVMG
jgi:hypothetical protein